MNIRLMLVNKFIDKNIFFYSLGSDYIEPSSEKPSEILCAI